MEDENEEFLPEETPAERDNLLDEQIILSGMEGDPNDIRWMISAYRIPNDGGKDVALFRLNNPREIINIMDRLMKYGTGSYRVIAYRNGKIFKRMIYPVEVIAETQTQERGGDNNLALVLSAMREEQAATRALLERAMERPAPQSQIVDPMAMMERTLGIAANLAGLRPEQNQNAMTPDAMITLITKGMEIANTAKGSDSGGAGETNWMDLVKGFFASPLAENLARQVAPAPQSNPQAPIQQIPTQQIPQSQIPLAQNPIPSPQDAQAIMLQQIIQTLGNFSAMGDDPGSSKVLDWFFMNVPEGMIDALLREPNVLDRLSAAFPVIREKRGWFTAFLAEVQKESVEPSPDNERTDNGLNGNTGRAGGGAGNAQSDAPSFNRDAPDRSTH